MKLSKKRILILIALMGIIAVAVFVLLRTPTGSDVTLPTNDTGMRFDIADTPDTQQLGLGNRASVPDNYGMLFVFQKADRYGFWMKDMLVPIDMVWLGDDGSIILIDHSVDPDTYPHAFYPPVPVRYVLETRAGYASEHGWTVGTKVALPAPYGS